MAWFSAKKKEFQFAPLHASKIQNEAYTQITKPNGNRREPERGHTDGSSSQAIWLLSRFYRS